MAGSVTASSPTRPRPRPLERERMLVVGLCKHISEANRKGFGMDQRVKEAATTGHHARLVPLHEVANRRQGTLSYGVSRRMTVRFCALLSLSFGFASSESSAAVRFQRGDTTADGNLEITDAIATLGYLFLGQPANLGCEDAGDADDDGDIQINDAVYVLSYLFLGGPAPKPPFGACGFDLTPDGKSCGTFLGCPPGPLPAPTIVPPETPTTAEFIDVRGTAPGAFEIEISSFHVATTWPVDQANWSFVVPGVELRKNEINRLFATAISSDRLRSAPTPFVVTHDDEPPGLNIDEPLDGAELTQSTIVVAGRVSDMLSGFMGLEVTVNGLPANVVIGIGTNGTFERAISLTEGDNPIDVIARDKLGNQRSKQITVKHTPIPVGSYRMRIVSGDRQVGTVLQELAEPLVVQVLKRDGTPFPGKLVNFRVTRSDGRLSETQGATKADGKILLQSRTDQQGFARAFWRLGADAGCGNNRVSVTSTSILGTTTSCASAMAGPPLKVNIGSGNNQRGEAGGPAAEPLRAWVNDSCNGVEGVPVSFVVVQGGGLVNGQSSVSLPTSRTGHVEVDFTYGPERGNNIVIADYPENPGLPAQFVLYGVPRGDGQKTTFRGIVLNNSRYPVAGATCVLALPNYPAQQTESLPDGSFFFDDVPGAGPGLLLVEGQTAPCTLGGAGALPCVYPQLVYDVTVIPNADNTLPTPVLLPKLDPRNDVEYDGTKEVVLTVAGIEGLKMTVKAGSVTLLDRSRPSPENPVKLRLNQVHHDDVPMPMPDGAAPPFAWTLQPAGAKFDPPVEIEYPNMSALAPGTVGYFLSFNHDTSRFEIVASGHVKDDGSAMVSDPGSGLTLAGWGCNCPPYAVTGDCCGVTGNGGGAGTPGLACCIPSCIPGTLTGGHVANNDPCLGETLEFIASGVLDMGGRRINSDCSTVMISGVPDSNISYSRYEIKLPDSTLVTGRVTQRKASVLAELPGEYTITFFVNASRACTPPEYPLSASYFLQGTQSPLPTISVTLSQVQPSQPITVRQQNVSCLFGFVEEEEINVEVDAACDSNEWYLTVTSIDGLWSTDSAMPSSMTEVTGPPPGGNTTFLNFCAQTEDLHPLTRRCPGGWWMIDATKAHERVHEAHLRPTLEEISPAIQNAFKEISIPYDPNLSRTSAKGRLLQDNRVKPTLEAATLMWRTLMNREGGRDHVPAGPTDQAEDRVTKPMRDAICQYAKANGWFVDPPCGGCQ